MPEVRGTLASLRRRWVRRVGWYPGDWMWIPLLALVVAGAGAAAAIAVSGHRRPAARTLVATGAVPARDLPPPGA